MPEPPWKSQAKLNVPADANDTVWFVVADEIVLPRLLALKGCPPLAEIVTDAPTLSVQLEGL
jgi:hypothetical protein